MFEERVVHSDDDFDTIDVIGPIDAIIRSGFVLTYLDLDRLPQDDRDASDRATIAALEVLREKHPDWDIAAVEWFADPVMAPHLYQYCVEQGIWWLWTPEFEEYVRSISVNETEGASW